MSATTRINRPTTATPRNLKRERMWFRSTNYRWTQFGPNTPAKFVKVAPGDTYRKGME